MALPESSPWMYFIRKSVVGFLCETLCMATDQFFSGRVLYGISSNKCVPCRPPRQRTTHQPAGRAATTSRWSNRSSRATPAKTPTRSRPPPPPPSPPRPRWAPSTLPSWIWTRRRRALTRPEAGSCKSQGASLAMWTCPPRWGLPPCGGSLRKVENPKPCTLNPRP